MNPNEVCFVTYCESAEGLDNALILAKSIRRFAGTYAGSDILIASPEEMGRMLEDSGQRLREVGVEYRLSRTPVSAKEVFYGGKPYAAASIEQHIQDRKGLMIWIDNDAVVIKEPAELILSEVEDLAYIPVMHNRAGSVADKPPDEFWAKIYSLQQLKEAELFTMVTPVDQQSIRAYFHCGLLAVHPSPGVMQSWAEEFDKVHRDPEVRAMCHADTIRRVFLHQHVLTGAILRRIARESMRELSHRYNYPMLFETQYESPRSFRSLHEPAVIRIVVSLSKIGPEWYRLIEGPSEVIDWLITHQPHGES